MARSAIAAKSFIVQDGSLLILKRASDDPHCPALWEIPGGRLDAGEDPREGLKRETLEETGIEIEVMHPLNVQHFVRDDGQPITMLIFLCKALSGEVTLSDEHSDYEWIPISQCKEKLTRYFHKEVDLFNTHWSGKNL